MFKKAVLGVAMATAFIGTASAEQGDWLVRLRAINVDPTEETGGIEPGIPTGSVSVDSKATAELDFTYFFTNNVAAELILATTKHDINGTGDVAALGKVAEVGVLPPTLTLQYHFQPGAQFSPYVGAGLNYTLFYDEDASASLNGALGDTTVSLDDSFGIAVQAGFDYALQNDWFFNVDVKYIQIDTDAELNTSGTINTIEVDLDPVVLGVGIGRRF